MAFESPIGHSRTNDGRRRFLGPGLVLLAAAIATAPIFLHGSFCGDDFEFHLVSWFDVQQSWRHGVAFPHWMPSANYGAGEPRFMFYPPLTFMLGAALGFVLPWQAVPIAVIFLLLAATGLATRALAQEALPEGPATLAGCLTLFSGFALFTAYERTAFAELTGGFWIPLLLLFALRDQGHTAPRWRRVLDRSTAPLSLIVAGAWLSDGPVGLMASYLLAAVAIAASALTRSWAPVFRSTIAAAVGIGLAGFFLIPAAREQSWVDLRAATNYPVFKIENNWLFAHHAGSFWIPFDAFLRRASLIAVFMIAVALASGAFLFLRYRYLAPWNPFVPLHEKPQPFATRWWMVLALIPPAVLFLQLPFSIPLWHSLPKLGFLQYPWRWLLVLEAPMAVFLAAAVWPANSFHRRAPRAVAALCALFFLTATCFAANRFLRPCKEGETAADLLALYQEGGGMEGADEYEPPATDHWKIARGLPSACFSAAYDTALGVVEPREATPLWRPEQGSCEWTASAQLREPEHIRLVTIAPRAGFLILRLTSYPAWRVTVNGKQTIPAGPSNPTDPSDPRDDGLIAIPVPPGPVSVAVDWTATPDVQAGRWISGLAFLALIALWRLEQRLSRLPIS